MRVTVHDLNPGYHMTYGNSASFYTGFSVSIWSWVLSLAHAFIITSNAAKFQS